MRKFKRVAVGGTFDELHKGHRALLSKAFEEGEEVVVGLSSDEFVAKMAKPHITASYTERRKELLAFLEKEGWADRAKIVPLNDSFGLTISGRGLEALVVSRQTATTASRINEIRCKASLPPLEIVPVEMVPSDNCSPISTTRIRNGEIDREGHLLNVEKGRQRVS